MEDFGLGLRLRGFGDPLGDRDFFDLPYRSRDLEREVLLLLDEDGDLLLLLALGGGDFFGGLSVLGLVASSGLVSLSIAFSSFFVFFPAVFFEVILLLPLLELPEELDDPDEPVELAELDLDPAEELPLLLPEEL